MDSKPNVVSISFGQQLFDVNNHEHKRHVEIAKELGSLDMVVFTKRTDKTFSVIKGQHGLTIHPTNSRSKFTMLFDALRIASNIIKQSSQPPIVTTQDPAAAGLVGVLLKWRHSIHLVVQEHCDILSTDFWRNESLRNSLQYYVSVFVLRRADVVRVVAKRSVAALRHLHVTAPITQLPVAIDASVFEAAQTQRPHRQDIFQYVSVARFVKQKNVPLLIRAFAAAHARTPKLKLRLIGHGPEEAVVREEIAKQFPPHAYPQPPITLEPWTDDVASVLKAADAYVLSSNYEGWGRVLIEALVAELPIVTTDVGCVGEVIMPSKHALVVPINDRDALTKALSKLAIDTEAYQYIREEQIHANKNMIAGTGLTEYGSAWRNSLTPRDV